MKDFGFYYVLLTFIKKCALVVSLKDKKGIIITNAFQKILDEPGRKPSK